MGDWSWRAKRRQLLAAGSALFHVRVYFLLVILL